MTEANGQIPADQGQQSSGQPPPQANEAGSPPSPTGEGVVLSPEQYNAVLDHIADLEAKLMSGGSRSEVQTLDTLVNEAQQQARPQQQRQQQQQQPIPQQADLENMTPQQVLSLLYNQIQTNLIQPLDTKIETLRIMSEIDKVAGKAGNEDFWEYAAQVKEIAIRNPTLSIQQAYRLAKTEEKRELKGPGDSGLQKKSDVLFTLPKRPNIPTGEKPGSSGAALRSATQPTRRDAASEAFDKVVSGKK
jgi:hypothetical protein